MNDTINGNNRYMLDHVMDFHTLQLHMTCLTARYMV